MLTIKGSARRLCGRIARRDFLQIGTVGALGLSLPSLLRAGTGSRSIPDASFGRAKKCIFVYLWGGPSQLDLWDMKPEAPAEVRGPLKPIATNVPGIQVSELLPLTARQADKYKIVRSVTHTDREHTTSIYTMLTGTYHPRPNVVQQASPQDHPHLGSIYAKWHGWRDDLPPFLVLPALISPNTAIYAGQRGGFLGKRYDPFVIRGDKQRAQFQLPDIELPAHVSAGRLEDRRALLDQANRAFRSAEDNGRLAQMDTVYQQAFSLISSGAVQRAMDLDREPDKVRDRYGRHLFGQGMLLARRLIEAGIPLVTIYWIDPTPPGSGGGEYDSHGRIYDHYPNRLVPPTDQALASLFTDLSERGLLDDTLVVVMGEFGRTPKINSGAGRDHWPQVQSILLAGAGITGGSVYGASDRIAAYPAANPVTPPDLAQTILHLLGVPADLELHDPQGRPVLACQGTRIPELYS